MRILVITSEPRWVNAVRTAFAGAHDVVAGDPRQLGGLAALLSVIDSCFIAETETGPFTAEALKQVSASVDVPLFAIADTVKPEWEEAALIAGARQVFRAPLRSGIVQLAVTRAARTPPSASTRETARSLPQTPISVSPARDLSLWRDFSRLLVHSPSASSFKSLFLSHLSEALGCGRLVLYTRRTAADPSFEGDIAVGIDLGQFDGFRLHFGHGLGRLVGVRSSVVWRHRLRSDTAEEMAALREMTLFGAEIAVPLAAQQGCLGILLVGPRIAGADYSDQEVTHLYHILEALATATSRLPEPTSTGEIPAVAFPAVLQHLPVGCALIDESLRVHEANAAFRSQFGGDASSLEHLPPAWADAIARIRDGRQPEARVELDHALSGAQRHVRISLQPAPAVSSQQWLLVTEDITNERRLQLEVHERSAQNVLQRAGEQLSNEFRNALTPIEILVQLSAEPNGRRDIDRLRAPVAMAIHRLRRRVDNLGYLTRTSIVPENTTVSAVFRSARERLDNWLEPKQLKTLVWSGEFSRVSFVADSAAIGLAIAELVMNAIEAAGGRQVTITADDLPEAVHFKVRNPGEWAPPSESTGFGHRPFFTAKSAGVGLGVEVVSRVAEYHGGRLVLGPIASDVVEAILRVPRNAAHAPTPVLGGVTAAL